MSPQVINFYGNEVAVVLEYIVTDIQSQNSLNIYYYYNKHRMSKKKCIVTLGVLFLLKRQSTHKNNQFENPALSGIFVHQLNFKLLNKAKNIAVVLKTDNKIQSIGKFFKRKKILAKRFSPLILGKLLIIISHITDKSNNLASLILHKAKAHACAKHQT